MNRQRTAKCPSCLAKFTTTVPAEDTDDLCEKCETEWVNSAEYKSMLEAVSEESDLTLGRGDWMTERLR